VTCVFTVAPLRGIGWFGFLVCVLALIVMTLVGFGRGIARRATA
jgi:hypothetical protein